MHRWARLPAFKSAAHALNRGVNFFIGEGPSQQVFHEFFRYSVCFPAPFGVVMVRPSQAVISTDSTVPPRCAS